MSGHNDRSVSAAPTLSFDPDRIRENVAELDERVEPDVTGVTKAACAHPAVAEAMIEGGATRLADSRIRHLRRLGRVVNVPLKLLRVPMPSELPQVVEFADISMQTERGVVRSVAEIAERNGVDHAVIALVDMGDRREGLLPDEVDSFVRFVEGLDGIELAGLAMHTGSFGGVLPSAESKAAFVELVESAEASIGRQLRVVSGGSTVDLPLAERGQLPERITSLRLGESVLLGTDVTRDRRIPYLHQDAFELRAEVIESRRKPSRPAGERGQNITGRHLSFDATGQRLRAILALGEQDTNPDNLKPHMDGIQVLGASSDHTVLDAEKASPSPGPGAILSFEPGYTALARAAAAEGVSMEAR